MNRLHRQRRPQRLRWLKAALLAGGLVAALAAGATTPAERSPSVDGAWLRATPPGMSMAAVYLRLHGGADPERLVGASCACADLVEIHATLHDSGMARMRQVEGLDLSPATTVEFAPQGHHLMLIGLRKPLVSGEQIELQLEFASGARLMVIAEVRAATALAGAGGAGHRH